LPSKEVGISEKQGIRLRSALQKMPLRMLYSLADKYDVEIPFDMSDVYSIVDSFLDELDSEAKKEILQKYADAGKVSTFVFITKEANPPINDVITIEGI
jgi:hypothetical protein